MPPNLVPLEMPVTRNGTAAFAVALIALAAPLSAQEKPTPAMAKAIAGTWQIDTVRSELQPAALTALLGPGGQRPAAPPPTADSAPAAPPAAAGGGRRGGGGGGGGGGARGLGPRNAGAANGNMRVLSTEIRVARTLVLEVTETSAITTDIAGYKTTWTLDGKKRPVAQMEGGVVEYLGEWHGKTLLLEKGIPAGGSVRREFKPIGENELEVKLTVNVGKKIEQKLVYVRGQ
jgi:hypothetical protein